jgi:serine protease AprX
LGTSVRVVRSLFLLLLILGFGPQAHAQLPTEPAPLLLPQFGKLDPLLQQAVWSPTGRSRVIVRANAAESLGAVAALVRAVGGTLGRELPILDAQVANVPNLSLLFLTSSSLVKRIAMDRPVVRTMERTGATIGSTLARQELGYDGTGVTVAVVDSGVTSWHDDLTGTMVSQRVDRFVDFVNGHQAPYDDYGHGTHVAGIIGGNGFDSNGARAGIAPGVGLAVLKVLDAAGRGRISDVIAAFDYVLANQQVLPVRVINVSLGAGVFESYNSDFLTLAAKRAVDAGIVVVVAAGNNGRHNGTSQYGGVTAPGNAPWVLTVGAASHGGTVDRTDDTVAGFSSRGPTLVDRAAKPDLVAPGVGIESLSDPNSSMYASRSPYLLDGTVPTSYLPYLSLSGTSQATPVVSGTVALMLQAAPALTPNLVKAILQYTSQAYAGYDALTQGAGFLNAHGAIELARFFAAPSASPYPSRSEWSHQLIWGNHRVSGGRVTPNASAWSSGVTWGRPSTPAGDSIAWGVVWSSLGGLGGAWTTWGAECLDAGCNAVVWGGGKSDNVVWGSMCGGADCPQGTPVGATSNGNTFVEANTVVWGTDDADTVVWGTDGTDTVVWGTDGADTVVWGTDGADTVVWGTDGTDTVVWGTDCQEPSCLP